HGAPRHQRPLAVQQRAGELGTSPSAVISGRCARDPERRRGIEGSRSKSALLDPPARGGGSPPALNFREITTVSRHAMDRARWGGSGQKKIADTNRSQVV